MYVSDAAVGGPGLGAVQNPFVGCLRVDSPGPDRADITARVGFGRAERAEFDVVRAAEHLRQPLADLLGRAAAADGDRRQAASGQREADSGVAPEDFLEGDRRAKAGRFQPLPAEEVERVEPDLRGLFQDGPGRLLALVPLGGRRPHDIPGKLMHPVAHIADILGQVERELAARRLAAGHLLAIAHRGTPCHGREYLRQHPVGPPRPIRGTAKLLKSSMAGRNPHQGAGKDLNGISGPAGERPG